MSGVTRIEQTIFANDPDGVLGNCLQACVAMVLGLPLKAVPHFVLFDDWRGVLHQWAADRGYKVEYAGPFRGTCDSQPVLAFGRSARGVSHSVVWQNGRVIADPHVSQEGLVGDPDEMWMFVPIEKVTS